MTVAIIVVTLAAGAALARQLLHQRRFLHLLQLEHYENARLRVWLARRREYVNPREATVEMGLAIAVLALAAAGLDLPTAVVALLLAVALAERSHRERNRPVVKPLVFTPRATRLFRAALAPCAIVLIAGLATAVVTGSAVPLAVALLAITSTNVLAAPLLMLANRAMHPIEQRINDRFVHSAQARLAQISPRVIGITGSYGKTTTKVCVGAVLSEQEQTLITPASFNSFLGVVRTINEHLEPQHRNLVVEMGMYRRGDIAELCDLVHPTIGVLTAIGPMHLERLGSIEAIAEAKAELAQALPAEGHLIVNGDDARCIAIADQTSVATTRFGIESPTAEVSAAEIAIVDGMTTFELRIGAASAPVVARLLGRHNVSNLLAAAAVGHVVGMPIEAIARGLAAVEPPAHRLQPIHSGAAGVVVIDDAYNSNPVGAAAALDVLKSHPAKRRILVTPGMVELGDREQELNEQFGRHAAEVCDHVILVGPARTQPVAAGLLAGGLGSGSIQIVGDITAATEALRTLTRPGDVVLFENDLPDLYAEDSAVAVTAGI